jgi:inositol oxygenase
MRSVGPLDSIEQWDDFVASRYNPKRAGQEFRQYTDETPPVVREFYLLNHKHQTVDFVRMKKAEYLPLDRRRMGVWEALEFLNTLVDDSDPDTDLSQIEHALQTAEALRHDGKPRWFILTGLIHDLGKVLCLYGEPQWAVVGDTFPTGCAWDESIVYREFFAGNPDSGVPEYQTRTGIYEEGCGLDRVNLSWGHDEYLYHVIRDYLPVEAQYMIRYHSFYPAHRHGAYDYLMDDRDREMFRWVREFNPYDLYSKSAERPDFAQLRPYYEDLISEYFPPALRW